jgi:hypothetical protein
MGDLREFDYCLDPLVFLLAKTFNLCGFQICCLLSYLMKIIPDIYIHVFLNIHTFNIIFHFNPN